MRTKGKKRGAFGLIYNHDNCHGKHGGKNLEEDRIIPNEHMGISLKISLAKALTKICLLYLIYCLAL